jgi:hypothetical protein
MPPRRTKAKINANILIGFLLFTINCTTLWSILGIAIVVVNRIFCP